MAARQTYFGIRVPAWKEEKVGAGQMTIWFVLQGGIVSLKNNRSAVADRREAHKYIEKMAVNGVLTVDMAKEACRLVKPKIRPNREYREFIETQKPMLEMQKQYWLERLAGQGLQFPLKKATMSIRFYFKHEYETDTINKQQTIQDFLVEMNVLKNDDYKVLNPIKAKSACFKNEINENICFCVLSFQNDRNRKIK